MQCDIIGLFLKGQLVTTFQKYLIEACVLNDTFKV